MVSKSVLAQWLRTNTEWASRGRTSRAASPDWYWTDSFNPAQQFVNESAFTANWPTEAVASIQDLSGYSSDFYTAAWNQCNAAASPIILRLPAEKLHLTSFTQVGGNTVYAYGFYHPRCRGFLGRGAGDGSGNTTCIQQDAGSINSTQLAALEILSTSQLNGLSMFLIQPTGTIKSYVAGLRIQAADQPNITTVHSTMTDSVSKPVVTPQSAPHSGLIFGSNKDWQVSFCELFGAGKAVWPAPPFEHTNCGSQYSKGSIFNVWSDGRRAADLDSSRPARCNPWMMNNEDSWYVENSRFSYSNISRLAANDQNSGNTETSAGPYTFGPGFQIDHIGNHNVDPNLNGGVSLGGYSQAVASGWESTASAIVYNQPCMSVDNPFTDGSVSQHIGLNYVSSVNRQGGRLKVFGGIFHNSAFPWLEGWLCIRISQGSYWYTDGVANTVFVYAGINESSLRKLPWEYTGAWNQTAMQAAMVSAGVNKETHYLLRNTVT